MTGSAVVQNGDTIQVRLSSSSQYSQTKSLTLTYGTKTVLFSITTKSDPTIITPPVVVPVPQRTNPQPSNTSSSKKKTTKSRSSRTSTSGSYSPNYEVTTGDAVVAENNNVEEKKQEDSRKEEEKTENTAKLTKKEWRQILVDLNTPKTTASVDGSTYGKEQDDAYIYAFGLGLTDKSSIDIAGIYNPITRKDAAKAFSLFAIKVLGKKPDTTKKCSFQDATDLPAQDKLFMILSCQLGLMGLTTDGIPAEKFNPSEEMTRAMFGTTLSRTLWGSTYNGGEIYFAKHFEALNKEGYMKVIDKPDMKELVGYVYIMLMRIGEKSE